MMIDRIIENSILQKLQPQKGVLIFGARRVGKTVLLKKIIKQFNGKTLLLNGEDLESRLLLEIQSAQRYRELLHPVGLLAIDEAQNIPDIGKIIKLILDEVPDISVIATGSSAFDLLNKTGEPLVGRASSFHLFPFSQAELNSIENPLETMRNLESRLVFGSYPEICTMNNDNDRIDYLKMLVNGYLLKDILMVEGIRNSSKMLNLLRLVAFQVGAEISYEELAKQLGLSRNTVEHYLDLLSKVFIIYRLGAYSKNLRKEISKSSKWYFYDNGVRNALINRMIYLNMREDTGVLWENYLIGERVKQNSYHRLYKAHYFWRSYDQQEIDLIEEDAGSLSAFEFKWGNKIHNLPAAFAKAYPTAQFTVINRDNYAAFIN